MAERVRAALSPKDYVSTAIRQAGVSVTLGVFIGSALTSGIAFGIAAAYIANERVLRRLRSKALDVVTAARDAALTTREGQALQRALLQSVGEEPTQSDTDVPSPKPVDLTQPITTFDDPRMAWGAENGRPGGVGGEWGLEDNGRALRIAPTPGLDYWCRTFYTPLLVKTDGQAYVASVAPDAQVTITTAFTLLPGGQFDQAGIMIVIDERTWVKAGIEFVDGAPRLACVVTNNGFSDWSTSPWPGLEAAKVSACVRVSKLNPGAEQGGCLVFEAAPYDDARGPRQEPQWSMARIASLRGPTGRPWQVGVMAQSPIKHSGCSVRFHHICIAPKAATTHEAALPDGHGGL